MTKEQRLDKYYQKKFGITLAEVDAMSEKQRNVCAICGRAPQSIRLSVDHDHAYDRVKITIAKKLGKWHALAPEPYSGDTFSVWGVVRSEVKDTIRKWLRKESVRGLICMRCNRGLQMFEDSKAPYKPADRLQRASEYLVEFLQRKTLTKTESTDTIPRCVK